MKKLMVAFAVAAISVAGFADDWFTASFDGEASTGGEWVSAPEFNEGTLALTNAADPVVFAATDKKSTDDVAALSFSTTVGFEGYDELPEIAEGAKAGVCALTDGNFFVVGYDDEGSSNKWVDTEIAATFGEAIDVNVVVSNGVATYTFGESAKDVAVSGAEFGEVLYAGTGTVSALSAAFTVAEIEMVAITLPTGLEGGSYVVSNVTEGAEGEVAVDSSIPGGATYKVPAGATVEIWLVPADGYEVEGENPLVLTKIDGDTTVDVESLPKAKAIAYVAQAGEGKFKTLDEAFAAVEAGGTVTILTNVTVESLAAIDKPVTIDANGYVISLTNAAMTLSNDVTIICSGETYEKGVKNDAQITIAAGKTLDLSALSWSAGVVGSDAGTASFTLEAGATYKQGLGSVWDDSLTNIFTVAEGCELLLTKDDTVATITASKPAPTSWTVTFSTNDVEVVEAETSVDAGMALTEDQVPAFEGGSWDVDPLTAEITCDTNFNYTVSSEDEPGWGDAEEAAEDAKASDVWTSVPEGLVDANAKKLAAWAGVQEIDFANAGTILPEAFLLNCENDEGSVEAAKAAFKFTAIVPGEIPTIDGDFNGTLTIMGSSDLVNWAEAQDTDTFFKAVLTF